jgi:uncharacterized protein YjdB
MKHFKRILLSLFLCLSITIIFLPQKPASIEASSSFAFILLSKYSENVDIGDEFYIIAISSNGKLPTWKSSNSSIVSVNTFGKVTAKKAGSATITAKIRNAEASCNVTVYKTKITIHLSNTKIERGEILRLSASTSNNSAVTWKSSKKSVATVDERGMVTGMKPGETTITAMADGSSTTCQIKVAAPTIQLSKSKITLYRGQTAQLSATVSSGIALKWKTNKKSVAIVDSTGKITAVKHGSAIITATLDGVSKTCEVIVEQPVIKLASSELTLKKGDTKVITATVSSGNPVVWSTSNPNIATIDGTGRITALKKGRAYLYASEDGVKIRCIIYVTE